MNISGMSSDVSNRSSNEENQNPTIQTLQTKLDQCQKSGKYFEGISIMEKILALKKDQFGEDSVEFKKGIEKLCQLLNMSSMIYLEMEQFDKSLEQLRKAEMLQMNSQKMKAVTFNNMACYYRRTNKLRTALNYLLNALEIEIKLEENDVSLADTHLNLCAVLSQLDRHEEALEHSMLSIIMLQDEMLNQTLKFYKNHQANQQNEPATKKRKIVTDDRIAVLAIAYHNLGVEFEHLKRDDESMKLYQKAQGIAANYLGNQHSVVKKMEKVMKKAKDQQNERKRKIDMKNSYILQKNGSGSGIKEFYKETNRNDINNVGNKLKLLPRLKIQSPTNQMQNPYGSNPNSQIYGIPESNNIPSFLDSQQSRKYINHSSSNVSSPKTPKTSQRQYRFRQKPPPYDRYASHSQSRQENQQNQSQNKLPNYYDQTLTYNTSSNKTRNITLSQSSDVHPALNVQTERQFSPTDSLHEQAKTVFKWNQNRQHSQSYDARQVEDIITNIPSMSTPTSKYKFSQDNKRNPQSHRPLRQNSQVQDKEDFHDLYSEQPPPSHRDIRQSFIEIQLKNKNGSSQNSSNTNNNQVKTPIRETLEQEYTQNSSLTQHLQQEII